MQKWGNYDACIAELFGFIGLISMLLRILLSYKAMTPNETAGILYTFSTCNAVIMCAAWQLDTKRGQTNLCLGWVVSINDKKASICLLKAWFLKSMDVNKLMRNTHVAPLPILDNKVHEANMGPTWVLSAPDGPHARAMNLAIRGIALNASHQVLYIRICAI